MKKEPDYKVLYKDAAIQLAAMYKVLEVKDYTIELLEKARNAQAKVLLELQLRIEMLQNSVIQMPHLTINQIKN